MGTASVDGKGRKGPFGGKDKERPLGPPKRVAIDNLGTNADRRVDVNTNSVREQREAQTRMDQQTATCFLLTAADGPTSGAGLSGRAEQWQLGSWSGERCRTWLSTAGTKVGEKRKWKNDNNAAKVTPGFFCNRFYCVFKPRTFLTKGKQENLEASGSTRSAALGR